MSQLRIMTNPQREGIQLLGQLKTTNNRTTTTKQENKKTTTTKQQQQQNDNKKTITTNNNKDDICKELCAALYTLEEVMSQLRIKSRR